MVSTNSYKRFIKAKVRHAALKYLNEKKEKHSKISGIEYKQLETQNYVTSPLFSNSEVNLLFALRSRSVDCKQNFKNHYTNDLLCNLCQRGNDSQAHILTWSVLSEHFKTSDIMQENIEYDDIFKNHRKQKHITALFKTLIEIRKKLLEEKQSNPSTIVMMYLIVLITILLGNKLTN